MIAAGPRKKTLAHSTLAGVTYQYAATAANGVVQVGVIAVLARLIAPVEFGQVGLATAYVGFWALFAAFGIGSSVVQQSELDDRMLRSAFTLSILLGLLASALVFLTAPLAAQLLGSVSLTNFIRALSATFLLSSPGIVAEALLQREFEWQRLTRLNVLSNLAQSMSSVALAFLGLGAWALVGSSLLFNVLRTALLLQAHPFPKRFLVSGTELGELTRFGRSFTAARLLNYGAQQGDNVVVGRVLGLEPLGFYSRAFKLMMQPVTNFGLVITRVLFSIMARLQQQAERLRTAYLIGLAVISLVSAPLTALMVVLGPEIIQVLLGPRWTAAILPFRILSLGLVLRLPNLMTYTIDGFSGSIAKRGLREGLFAAGVITGALAGVPFGLPGVATGVLLGVVVNYVAGASISLQITGCTLREFLRAQTPGLILGVMTASVAAALREALLASGGPSILVLVGTVIPTLGLLAAVLYLYPESVGVYGRGAARMLAETLTNRHWGRNVTWVDRVSGLLTRRWVGGANTP
ncbi:MAG TPA: lipopolysaccharide biosynthesis protein [Gemmatimonadales bacterium]|nr:lipopolysaccharide biosynthesis protein [Gemmatimonadales bacterium]